MHVISFAIILAPKVVKEAKEPARSAAAGRIHLPSLLLPFQALEALLEFVKQWCSFAGYVGTGMVEKGRYFQREDLLMTFSALCSNTREIILAPNLRAIPKWQQNHQHCYFSTGQSCGST